MGRLPGAGHRFRNALASAVSRPCVKPTCRTGLQHAAIVEKRHPIRIVSCVGPVLCQNDRMMRLQVPKHLRFYCDFRAVTRKPTGLKHQNLGFDRHGTGHVQPTPQRTRQSAVRLLMQQVLDLGPQRYAAQTVLDQIGQLAAIARISKTLCIIGDKLIDRRGHRPDFAGHPDDAPRQPLLGWFQNRQPMQPHVPLHPPPTPDQIAQTGQPFQRHRTPAARGANQHQNLFRIDLE